MPSTKHIDQDMHLNPNTLIIYNVGIDINVETPTQRQRTRVN